MYLDANMEWADGFGADETRVEILSHQFNTGTSWPEQKMHRTVGHVANQLAGFHIFSSKAFKMTQLTIDLLEN